MIFSVFRPALRPVKVFCHPIIRLAFWFNQKGCLPAVTLQKGEGRVHTKKPKIIAISMCISSFSVQPIWEGMGAGLCAGEVCRNG